MPCRNGAGIRRSSRVTLRVPLKIYEPGTNKRFLVEEASALKVSLGRACLSQGNCESRPKTVSG
jgi:hypothetical protein